MLGALGREGVYATPYYDVVRSTAKRKREGQNGRGKKVSSSFALCHRRRRPPPPPPAGSSLPFSTAVQVCTPSPLLLGPFQKKNQKKLPQLRRIIKKNSRERTFQLTNTTAPTHTSTYSLYSMSMYSSPAPAESCRPSIKFGRRSERSFSESLFVCC